MNDINKGSGDPFERMANHFAVAATERAALRRHTLTPRGARVGTVLAVAAAVTAAVAVGVLAVVIVGSDKPAAADVKVERVGDSVTVSIENDVSVAEVRDALAAAGVDATVTPQVTGPSLRNRFVGISGGRNSHLQGGDGRSAATATFWYGSGVQLMLGVEGDDDDLYDVATVATDPGEPLAGETVIGITVGEVEALVERRSRGLTLDVRSEDGKPFSGPVAGRRVISALMSSPRTMIVFSD